MTLATCEIKLLLLIWQYGVETPDELEKNLHAQWEKQDEALRYPYGIQFSFGGIPKEHKERIENNTAVPYTLRYKVSSAF